MKVEQGKIVTSTEELKYGKELDRESFEDDEDFEDSKEVTYYIQGMDLKVSEDIPGVIGVVRCTDVVLKADAPDSIRQKAESIVMNMLADCEFNCIGGDKTYIGEARKEFAQITGIKESCIKIKKV